MADLEVRRAAALRWALPEEVRDLDTVVAMDFLPPGLLVEAATAAGRAAVAL